MTQRLTNLIPPQRLLVRSLRSRRHAWIVGLTAHLSLMLGISIAARQVWPGGSSALAAELVDAKQQIDRLNGQITKQRKLTADVAARTALINGISDQPNWSDLLQLIDQNVGDDITLKQTQLQEAGDHQFSLSLRGMAQSQASVTQFVLRLQQSNLFKDIRLGRSEREPFMSGSAISFELTCPIDGISGALP